MGAQMQASLAMVDYAPADQLEVWRGAAAQAFVPLDVIAGEHALRAATLSYQDLGGLRAYEIHAGPGKVIRGRKQIAESGEEFVLVSMQRAGTCVVSQNDRHAWLQPGELVCYDTTRPYTIDFAGPFHTALARIPRTLLGIEPDLLNRITARAIPTHLGVARMLAPLLAALMADPANYRGPAELDVGNALIHLTRALILEQTTDTHTTPSPATLLRERILRFVDQNLDEPDLSPRRAAQAHGISTRYLHQIFAESGATYSSHVRQRRLQAAARALRAPNSRNRTIASIARTYGFTDPAHFSHLFRNTYGSTPRQWSQIAQNPQHHPNHPPLPPVRQT
jgi:AraC-like DNA-binding protein